MSSTCSLPGDITSKDDIKRLADEVGQREPKGIHLLVNNAGVAVEANTRYTNSQPDFKDAKAISEHLWKSDPDAWQETFKTNVTGHFFVTAAFLPLLAQGLTNTPGYSPSIVNITSISAVTKGSTKGQFAYSSSKAAFTHLTRMMATTFAEAKIRVNAISPGIFPSEMVTGQPANEAQKSDLGDMDPGYPAGELLLLVFLPSYGYVE